jgi:krueppel-like factor 5
MCSENDMDPFLRPPLWEDITSSIQNIDPENAIMLSALTGATQVKLESSDDTFLESLSSPLLSPLEIKTEKGYYQQQQQQQQQQAIHNNNNNTIHLSQLGLNNNSSNSGNNNNNNSYSVQSHYNPQAHPNHQLNGYHQQQQQQQQQDFNVHHVPQPHQQYSNNYYNWQQNTHHHHHHHHAVNQQAVVAASAAPVYGNKYSSQSNLCAPISRLMYVPPLTPPSSDPGSPGNSIQVSIAQLRANAGR